MEQNLSENSKGYDLRPKIGKENSTCSMWGLALNQVQKLSAGRKLFLNKEKMQETKEIMEGKKATIGRDIRVRKAPSRVM